MKNQIDNLLNFTLLNIESSHGIKKANLPLLECYIKKTSSSTYTIIDTIKKGDYNNVIVMSDRDIGLQNNHGESYTVTGCVWWLWVDGGRAPKCVKELRGMQHNFECEIRAY